LLEVVPLVPNSKAKSIYDMLEALLLRGKPTPKVMPYSLMAVLLSSRYEELYIIPALKIYLPT
jgi:hypothetical protein